MKRGLFLLLFICIAVQISSAQPTIGMNDLLSFLNIKGTYEFSTSADIKLDLQTAGENRTWDFRAIDMGFTYKEQNQLLTSDNHTFAWHSSKANYLLQNSIPQDTVNRVLTFLNIKADRIEIDSRLIRNPSSTMISGTHPDDYIPLPLSYGTQWQSIRIDTMLWNDGQHIATTFYDNYIDAYGTLRLPLDDFHCLRWRQMATRILDGDTTSYIEYTWIAKENIFVAKVQSKAGETDPNFDQPGWVERFTGLTTGFGVKTYKNLPEIYRLAQNHPNPFNATTSIEFFTPGYGWIELKLFNTGGQVVKTLISGHRPPGKHSVRWDGKDMNGNKVASGLYIYRLISPNHIQSRTLVYLK
ncbi:hypothetical protein GF407_10980 [candidate division KSB1 bacterium]|nr:hypothetical protein [candidate division KSB1 bacterium]